MEGQHLLQNWKPQGTEQRMGMLALKSKMNLQTNISKQFFSFKVKAAISRDDDVMCCVTSCF